MIEWISNNKEWIFSGAGIFLLTIIGRQIFVLSDKRKKQVELNSVKNEININNYSPVGNINPENLDFKIPVRKYGEIIKYMDLKLTPEIAIVSTNLKSLNAEKIIEFLVHKIGVHYFIFQFPNPSAILPVNSIYFGNFSWDETTIICNQLFQIPEDADLNHWKLWTSMQSEYVEMYCSEHRQPNWKYSPDKLKSIIKKLNYIINDARKILELGIVNRKPIEMTIINIQNIIEKIDFEYESIGQGNPVVQLELAISYSHDIIKRLMPRVIKI